MCHVDDIEVGGRSPGELDGEAFQSARLPASSDELTLIDEGYVADALEMSHVSHAQVRHRGAERQLKSFESSRLAPCAGKLVVAEPNVADALQMDQNVHRWTAASIERPDP